MRKMWQVIITPPSAYPLSRVMSMSVCHVCLPARISEVIVHCACYLIRPTAVACRSLAALPYVTYFRYLITSLFAHNGTGKGDAKKRYVQICIGITGI